MCLHLTITPLDNRAQPMNISDRAAASGLYVTSHERAVALTPIRECGCGFSGQSRATDPDWRVRQDLQAPLIAAIEFAAEHMKRFRFQATWMGEPAGTEITATVAELSTRIA
jgi:hypothetical protein